MEFPPQFAKASTTISPILIGHVRMLHGTALENLTAAGRLVDDGPHGHTDLAIPAYILAAAAIEAFVNETFLSSHSGMVVGTSIATKVAEPLERLSLGAKLVLVPHLVCGKSLDPESRVHRDAILLAEIRNELVHYKMGVKPPRAVKALARQGVALGVPREQEGGGPHPWPDRLSTLEGIRWAHNTACATALALVELLPVGDETERIAFIARHNFKAIP